MFCSPLTLFAVLAVIRQAVDNFQLSRTSHEILERLQGFEKQWDRFVEQMDKVGRNLKTASNAFEELEGTRRRGVERELEDRRARAATRTPDADGRASSSVLPLALEALTTEGSSYPGGVFVVILLLVLWPLVEIAVFLQVVALDRRAGHARGSCSRSRSAAPGW